MRKVDFKEWKGFVRGKWSQDEINVRDFIQKNYTPYEGDDSFLAGPTKATTKLWDKIMEYTKKEREAGGVLGMDKRCTDIDAYDAGYIIKGTEKIVGLQTDKLFIRAYMPIGGIRTAQAAAKAYNCQTDPKVDEIFTKYRKTHNQGVFDAYTDEMRLARKTHIITGLPDAYARGRIIGDYRRVALYGIDYLIEKRKQDYENLSSEMDENNIRIHEEITEQLRALEAMKRMAASYGFDISRPASNAQ